VFEKLKFHQLMFRMTPEHTVIRSWLDRLGATLEGIERDGSWDGKGGYTL
jgi:RimJ/RimL family protein N-acetyltransferase